MHHIQRRPAPSPIVAGFAMLAALALLVAPGRASAASATASGSSTALLDRPLSAERLGLPASAPAPALARAALRHSAKRLGLPGSLRGLQLLPELRAPKPAGARDLRTLRFQQTVGGRRVLYSQIDVAVVDDAVTSISATVVPLESHRLRGAERISAAEARAIARRRIAGPDSALRAQAIAYAGRPTTPLAPRRAWVVQVTPAAGHGRNDEEVNWCVVVGARTGKVLEVWKGVAARPRQVPRSSAPTSPAARAAQDTVTSLALIRDAKFVPGSTGTSAIQLYTRGNPFNFGDDDPGGGIQQSSLALPLETEVNKVSNTVRVVGRHMCVNRGFCGRDGGFDGTFNVLSVTARAPAESNPPTDDRGTRYSPSQHRVYIASKEAGSGDIAAHEFGHLIDLSDGGDRVENLGTDEVEEGIADMFAYDFDHNDTTIGEADSAHGFPVGNPRINLANPGAITNPVEKTPYPGHFSKFACDRTDPHFNGTIYSHAYFLFDQKVGREKASAVLYNLSFILGPFPGGASLPQAFIQRAGELFGSSVRSAAIAAWDEVGLGPNNTVRPGGKGCFID